MGETRSGRSILVTGGSRGIGAATARLAAARGYRVAIAYNSKPAQADALVRDIVAAGGVAKAFQADVGDPRDVEVLFARMDGALGSIDALVNSAGITGGVAGFLDLTPEAVEKIVAVNLLGTAFCIQQAARRMARSRGGNGGAIVNVSSEAARFGGNRISVYAAAKAGVNTLTAAVARELAPDGIRLNAVSPGVIDTDQHADIAETRRTDLVKSLPMGRMGAASEVAESILWLLSDQASYVSGAILTVAGGR